MKMLYRNNFDLRLHSKIRSDIYAELPDEVIVDDVDEVIKKADKIYAKIDKERINKAICRLDKLFADKNIVAICYGEDAYVDDGIIYPEVKLSNVLPYHRFEYLLKEYGNITITEIFVCKDFAKVDAILDCGRTLGNRSYYIKEVSSEQYDSYISQDFKSYDDDFNFCLDIYKQNKGITLRRAALGSVA